MPETPKVERVVLHGPDREARGRNGYFTPAVACVRRYEGLDNVELTVESRTRFQDMPPIYVLLPVADAENLHAALGRQIAAVRAASLLRRHQQTGEPLSEEEVGRVVAGGVTSAEDWEQRGGGLWWHSPSSPEPDEEGDAR